MSPNTHHHPHEFDPHLTPRRRKKRSKASPLSRLSLYAGGALAAGMLLTTTDVPGRVTRAFQDRPEFLRESIEHFSDKNFVLERNMVNADYYFKKGISDESDNSILANSLTRLDILVDLFHSGKLTETDFLYYIAGTDERIVTDHGVALERVVKHDGQSTAVRGSLPPEDLTTSFLTDLFSDANNPHKKKHNLQITPRPQGGGYILSGEFKGEKFTLELAFRLSQ